MVYSQTGRLQLMAAAMLFLAVVIATPAAAQAPLVDLRDLKPRQKMEALVHRPDGSSFKLPIYLMILTADEVAYFKNGGILPYVLRNLLAA